MGQDSVGGVDCCASEEEDELLSEARGRTSVCVCVVYTDMVCRIHAACWREWRLPRFQGSALLFSSTARHTELEKVGFVGFSMCGILEHSCRLWFTTPVSPVAPLVGSMHLLKVGVHFYST